MRVRLKPGWERTYRGFWPSNSYEVVAIEDDFYRIVDDTGQPFLFNRRAFEIIDAARPADWREVRPGEILPEALCEPRSFFEKLHDRNPDIVRRFRSYLNARINAREPMVDVCEQRRYVDELRAREVLVELDPEGVEVRRIEVRADGSRWYADANGGVGETKLESSGDHLRSPVRDRGTRITRAEFEAEWDRALDEESERAY